MKSTEARNERQFERLVASTDAAYYHWCQTAVFYLRNSETCPLILMLCVDHLFEHPEHLECVAEWIHAEFWADKDVHTPASLASLLHHAIAPDRIPLSLLALADDVPVGTINLVENDDENRTYLRPWLAALFVVPDRRRQGIGSMLVRHLKERAANLGIATVYLGTDRPGFYARFRAIVKEQITDDFAVMQLGTGNNQ